MKVYLCGGINGLSDSQCKDWREESKRLINHETVDPMRRDYRGAENDNVDRIVTEDLNDIAQCDIVLVNATKPSWGTAMEIVYAKQASKIVVCFIGTGRISPWLQFHSSKIVVDLAAAAEFINGCC